MARESLFSDIPAGDWKMANLFLQCIKLKFSTMTKTLSKQVELFTVHVHSNHKVEGLIFLLSPILYMYVLKAYKTV